MIDLITITEAVNFLNLWRGGRGNSQTDQPGRARRRLRKGGGQEVTLTQGEGNRRERRIAAKFRSCAAIASVGEPREVGDEAMALAARRRLEKEETSRQAACSNHGPCCNMGLFHGALFFSTNSN